MSQRRARETGGITGPSIRFW